MRKSVRNPAGRFFLPLLCAVLVAGLLAACGRSSDRNGEAASPSAGASSGAPAQGTPSASSAEKVTLSLLVDNTQESVTTAQALIDAFQKKHPNITIELETRPGGSEGDNFVKTRLATGDMNDIFFYNSGSLMQALNPEQNMVDLTNEPFMADVIDSFKPTVTFNGKIYGAPQGSAMGGGWLYNKKIYEQLGLSVPKTWAELMENGEKIKAAGITPVIGSFKDTWTSQLIVLADYYNVQAEYPNFAEDYTANKAKFATTPAALRSFEKLQEVHDRGFLNKDVMATTYDAAIKMLVEGKGAHYPMLTFALPVIEQNYPDKLNDIGFFAQPSDSPDIHGLTVWMPGGAYIYKNSKHIEEAKQFVAFIASKEGTEVYASVRKPYGPWAIKGASLPDDVPQAVKDMLPYFESGKTAPALEFLSPVKGPNLEHITVEVGAGMKTAKEGAETYDKDVEKQAQQLGLPGW